MFPVPKSLLTKKNLEIETDKNYKALLQKEYRFIDSHKEQIKLKAKEVYNKIISNTNISNGLVKNSCNFKLLEEACIKYCKENSIEI